MACHLNINIAFHLCIATDLAVDWILYKGVHMVEMAGSRMNGIRKRKAKTQIIAVLPRNKEV